MHSSYSTKQRPKKNEFAGLGHYCCIPGCTFYSREKGGKKKTDNPIRECVKKKMDERTTLAGLIGQNFLHWPKKGRPGRVDE